eukprot:TRINITY_DN820_c0_g1_i1.p2 TRINITY_DN820_c0_g1~~TRINITY_DN820_c0_g1_i1.p2  ORF type:complete len:274 (+),score=51.79 TRINITY_DN820_c0_g1_i1:79-822(+)
MEINYINPSVQELQNAPPPPPIQNARPPPPIQNAPPPIQNAPAPNQNAGKILKKTGARWDVDEVTWLLDCHDIWVNRKEKLASMYYEKYTGRTYEAVISKIDDLKDRIRGCAISGIAAETLPEPYWPRVRDKVDGTVKDAQRAVLNSDQNIVERQEEVREEDRKRTAEFKEKDKAKKAKREEEHELIAASLKKAADGIDKLNELANSFMARNGQSAAVSDLKKQQLELQNRKLMLELQALEQAPQHR